MGLTWNYLPAKPSQVGIAGVIKSAYSIKARSQLGGNHLA
jgi:hypothetical protein